MALKSDKIIVHLTRVKNEKLLFLLICSTIFLSILLSSSSQLFHDTVTQDQETKSFVVQIEKHLPSSYILPSYPYSNERAKFLALTDQNNSFKFWYVIYFLLDIIWALIFVVTLVILLKIIEQRASLVKSNKFSAWISDAIVVLGIVAWIFKIIEDLHYLRFTEGILSEVIILKVWAFRLFVGLTTLLSLYYVTKRKHLKIITVFILSSFLSLLLIGVIVLILTTVGQGGTIIVDLYQHEWNFLILFFLINFSAIVLSHFPSYISEILQPNSKRNIRWHKYPRNRFWGIVYFDFGKEGSGSGKSQLDSFLRRSLGTFLFLSWIYAIFFTLNNYILHWHKGLFHSIFFGISIIILYKHYHLIKISSELNRIFKESSKSENKSTEEKEQLQIQKRAIISKMNLGVWIFRGATFIAIMGTLIISFPIIEWGKAAAGIVIFISLCNVIAFIHFRENRSHLMYFLGIQNKWSFKDPEDYNKDNSFVSYNFEEDNLIIEKAKYDKISLLYIKNRYRAFKFIGNLSNHIFYLLSIRAAFIIISITIIGIALVKPTSLNPVIYIIYFFTALTYLLAGLAKQFIYYYQTQSTNKSKSYAKAQMRFKFYVPIILTLLIAIGAVGINGGNNLHKFPLIQEDPNENISLQQFEKDIQKLTIQDSIFEEPIISLASFGGGLKANYWTINLLNSIQDKSNDNFIDRTLSMSGVSGGAMGLALYPFIHKKHNDTLLIDKIGSSNILSIDASYFLFQDLAREFIPNVIELDYGKDRSYYAMNEYDNLLRGENLSVKEKKKFDNKSYRNQWAEFYNIDNDQYYPALIMNTTSTNRKYGYACSLDSINLEGGINIVDYPTKDSSISYYNAASTVNRFAFVSPAASVPMKGHFVDGGYFENSGLLSTLSFWNEFKDQAWIHSQNLSKEKSLSTFQKEEYCYTQYTEDTSRIIRRPLHIVCLINGKGYWINHLLKENNLSNIPLKIEKSSAEIGAILKTISGTDMLPTYYIEYLDAELGKRFHPIYMPLSFSYEDVINVLGGEPEDQFFNQIKKMIIDNKNKIKVALKSAENAKQYNMDWGVVEPTLSRLQSEPDRAYQRAMINYHPDLTTTIDSVAALAL